MRSIEARDSSECVAVEMILADDLAVIFDDRNADVIIAAPVSARVDIVNHDLEPAAYERQQFFDQNLAQVASLPAVDVDGLQQSRAMVGVRLPRHGPWRSRQRLAAIPAPTPSSAATAAAESPSTSA
jgi:hypothetical protein